MSNLSQLSDGRQFFKELPHYLPDQQPGRRFTDTRKAGFKGGVPLAYDPDSRSLAIDPYDSHTIIWGATGSRKTRSIIMPTVKILGAAGESMIINDPKGEIFSRCGGELKDQGYEIIVLNVRNPELSNAWNPLWLPMFFYNMGNIDQAAEMANDVAANLTAEAKKSNADPFWDNSAAACLFGLIMLLLRYCRDHELGADCVNINNLIVLRQKLFEKATSCKLSPLWKYAQEDPLTSASLSGTVYAPNETQASILSVLDQKLRTFIIRPSLLEMLANNDVDLGVIAEKPCAVFMILPDEKTTYNALSSLFIKQTYEYLIYKAAENPSQALSSRVNYILDEFAALPPISDMATLISAGRSRNIRFMLAVQSLHQLIQRYGDDADTIKGNCTNWIFLFSRELDLLREISALCGEKPNGKPRISVYDLQHLNKDRCEAVVLSNRLQAAQVRLLDVDRFGEREYTILDFESRPRVPVQKLDFKLPGYDPVPPKPSTPPPSQSPLLQTIHACSKRIDELENSSRKADASCQEP